MSKQFYVVHTYSGYENRVKQTIVERARQHGLEEAFGEILIPTEQVVEVVKGERRTSKRKFFPGYIIIEMEMTPKTWHLVRTTPRVSGFVGGKQPEEIPPIRREEMERLTSQIADALVEGLSPGGVIVVIECEHLCMSMRGVRKPGARTITSAVRGQMRNAATRAEAMSLIAPNR